MLCTFHGAVNVNLYNHCKSL